MEGSTRTSSTRSAARKVPASCGGRSGTDAQARWTATNTPSAAGAPTAADLLRMARAYRDSRGSQAPTRRSRVIIARGVDMEFLEARPEDVNVGTAERGVSVTLGAALIAFAAARRRPVSSLFLA